MDFLDFSLLFCETAYLHPLAFLMTPYIISEYGCKNDSDNNCQAFYVLHFFLFIPFYLFSAYKNFPYAVFLSSVVFFSFILKVRLLYLWQQSVLFCLYLFLGLKVNRLDMYGEKYKPFKGIKYMTKAGKFQVRT